MTAYYGEIIVEIVAQWIVGPLATTASLGVSMRRPVGSSGRVSSRVVTSRGRGPAEVATVCAPSGQVAPTTLAS